MKGLEMSVGMGLAALSALALALAGCADTDDAKPYSELAVEELVIELAEDGLLEPGRYRVTEDAGLFGLELEEKIDRG